MGRGLLSGLFWGGVASMVALLFASIYFPMRELVNRQSAPAQVEDIARATPDTAPDVVPDEAPQEVQPSRPLVADPPPPPAAAEVADTPPAEPEPPTRPEETAVLPERAPDDTAPSDPVEQAARQPAPLAMPDRVDEVPDASAPATLTVTPQTAPTPEVPRIADVAPQGTPEVPGAPPRADLPAPPPGLAPAPAADVAPRAEAAPAPTTLPKPAAAEAVETPQLARAAPAEPDMSPVPETARLPDELPARPAAPVAPGTPGTAPAPDLTVGPVPALVIDDPVADSAAARGGAAPTPRPLVAFAGPETDVPPAQPDLRLAALTQPIVDGPPRPQRAATPPQTPEQSGTPDAGPPVGAQVADAAPVPAPAQPPAAGGLARLQTDARTAEPDTFGLPRRIVVGQDGGGDGVSRLSARRLGTGGGRLPQIGVATDTETAPTPDPEVGTEPQAPVGALDRNAQTWDSDGPRAAVVLRATSPDRAITDVLASVNAPLAVALDPAWLESPQRAQALRAAGHEVLILLTGLPPDPEPRDIDVALNAHIARLPEAVGVLLPVDSPVSDDRALLSQLAARLAQTGHGLIALPRGLNTVAQVARAEGTALAPVETVLPARLAQAQAERQLDRLVFDAARDGSVVMLGETQADTLIALQNWVEGSDAQLAPVSAILREGL